METCTKETRGAAVHYIRIQKTHTHSLSLSHYNTNSLPPMVRVSTYPNLGQIGLLAKDAPGKQTSTQKSERRYGQASRVRWKEGQTTCFWQFFQTQIRTKKKYLLF